jgi:hypothetical protein
MFPNTNGVTPDILSTKIIVLAKDYEDQANLLTRAVKLV